jgi:hypothetical protein
VTPQEIERRLEIRAAEVQKAAPQGGARYIVFDIAWPASVEEYRALGKNGVMYLGSFSQKAEELPLRRVYARVGGKTVELQKLSSRRQDVSKDTLAHKIFGPYREDAFYLVPARAWREGQLLSDFAVNRNEFSFSRAPLSPPNFVKSDRSGVAGKPGADALKAFSDREFPGWAR